MEIVCTLQRIASELGMARITLAKRLERGNPENIPVFKDTSGNWVAYLADLLDWKAGRTPRSPESVYRGLYRAMNAIERVGPYLGVLAGNQDAGTLLDGIEYELKRGRNLIGPCTKSGGAA